MAEIDFQHCVSPFYLFFFLPQEVNLTKFEMIIKLEANKLDFYPNYFLSATFFLNFLPEKMKSKTYKITVQ